MEEVKFQSAELQPQATDPLRTAPKQARLTKILPFLILFLIVGLGIFTGLVAFSVQKTKAQNHQALSLAEEELSPQQQESFAQTFRDEAEGTIEKNDDLDKYAQ